MKLDTQGPKRMIRIAAILASIFLVGHLAGLRELTAIISGTMPATDWELMAGAFYALSWFGFVLIAPILALAGGAQLLVARVAERRSSSASERSEIPRRRSARGRINGIKNLT